MAEILYERDAPALAGRVGDVRRLTEQLVEPLSAEDQCIQSMPDVSPVKWHRAHTTWFFETFVLDPFVADYEPFDPTFGFLFNSYYEAVGPRHAPDRHVACCSRPGVAEVAAYRRHVDERLIAALDQGDLPSEALDLVELGLNHEQQHQELLLMDIKHVLAQNPTGPVYREGIAPGGRPDGLAAADAGGIHHDGGIVGIGHDGDGFAYDNEGPRHRALLEPFDLAAALVTCGDWIDFIDDGGYVRPALWLSDGWAHVNEHEWAAPLYWATSDDGWKVFTLGGWRDVSPHEPVCHVSYYEADAFARWAGCRLPTETEWEVVAAQVPMTGGLDLDALHPATAADGDLQLTGQVWQWTSSAYLPYPGFAPAAGAVGEYNGKFMVNQHVLRGGACVTPVGHTRATYRNFYPPASRWPFTGVRLAR